jgi:hypothetical protein
MEWKHGPGYWTEQAARAHAEAEQMNNPIAQAGMRQIAATYASFARSAALSNARIALLRSEAKLRE